MTPQELERIVREEIHKIAPDVDIERIDAAADLRAAADLDSVDFLNLQAALGQRTGVTIAGRDAAPLTTIQAIAAYLEARAGRPRP